MERRPAGQGRDGVLRLLSLDLIFADEHCAAALADEKLLAAMARFEAALAEASAEAGLIPQEAAAEIGRACARAAFDAAVLAKDARNAGTLAIPFVNALKAQAGAAGQFVHHGATSQDVMDTAIALCLKAAVHRIDALAVALGDAAAALARDHMGTPMLGRTLLQPALPVPFGWKAAMWLAPLARSLPHFRAVASQACVLQFGGPAGTLSPFGDKGTAVGTALARALGLPRSVTWHSARDAFARLGAELAMLAGISAKIARDVGLLMQPEIGEAAEPAAPGRGGSSSMAHKRNPAACLLALEAAYRAPALAATLLGQLSPEHERGIGQWQSQWFTLRELACASASALAAMAEVLQGLLVNTDAMRANIEREGRRLGQPFGARHEFGSAAEMAAEVLRDWASARGSAP